MDVMLFNTRARDAQSTICPPMAPWHRATVRKKLQTFQRKLAADTVLGLLQHSTEKARALSLSRSHSDTKQVGYIQ